MKKIRTNKGIFYFHDLDTGEYRRVCFGDTEEIYDFFIEQTKIMKQRLKPLAGQYKSKKALKKAIEDTKPDWMTYNDYGAFDDKQVIEFQYEIIKR